MICCFSDLSQTHFRGLRGIIIKIKGKTNKKVYENVKFVDKMSIFEKLFSVSQIFPNFLK